MKQILEALLSLNPQMRIVINVIALESVAAAVAALKDLSIEAEIVHPGCQKPVCGRISSDDGAESGVHYQFRRKG